MGKQSGRSRKAGENIQLGKGKVTQAQVAFLVDCYLADNNLPKTRSAFRSEAPHLLSKSPVQDSPKLLSLGELLDEYIRLKEHKLFMDQERRHMEQEKFRLQNLLKGMQDAMNAYNAGVNHNTPLPLGSSPPVPIGGYSVYNTPTMMPASIPSTIRADPNYSSTPSTDPTAAKRKRSISDAPSTSAAKRSHKSLTANQLPLKDAKATAQASNADNGQENHLRISAVPSSVQHNVSNVTAVQGSNVAKCLFNQANHSPVGNSSGPKTPPRASSSQTEKSISPVEISSTATSANNVTPQQLVSSNCMIISSETIRVSPSKQMGYYSIERNHCISTLSPVKTNLKPAKRDHVKGRLDFDTSDMPSCSNALSVGGASTSESDEGEMFDLDLATFDALGADFNLSELLVDFDLDGVNYCSPQQDMYSSPEPLSDSPNKSGDVDMGANQFTSQISSTVTEVLAKDTGLTDPDAVTTVKSVTKCIKILSPGLWKLNGSEESP
ncbi:PREDICTED: uncharacterized protein LOC109158997 isoform X2 [Ipomoea nil]|uniref:uncharacterized protein LOC109158997 isoform X2 n=1 Tax=Ipomoea nil TaxID=35883 RepID=UPI000900DDA7|nr:PREDICTED: uncharacterized protein LOC109158997 isoform X2 [Ipomoea nil]